MRCWPEALLHNNHMCPLERWGDAVVNLRFFSRLVVFHDTVF